jgi:hypothetical protein
MQLLKSLKNASRRTGRFEKVKENFDGLFFNSRRYDLGKVGRYKVNKKLDGMAGFAPSDVTQF